MTLAVLLAVNIWLKTFGGPWEPWLEVRFALYFAFFFYFAGVGLSGFGGHFAAYTPWIGEFSFRQLANFAAHAADWYLGRLAACAVPFAAQKSMAMDHACTGYGRPRDSHGYTNARCK